MSTSTYQKDNIKIFLIGGEEIGQNIQNGTNLKTISNGIDVIEDGGDKIRTVVKNELKDVHFYKSTCVFDGSSIYVIGGLHTLNRIYKIPLKRESKAFRLDIDIGSQRVNHVSIYYNKYIYILGGSIQNRSVDRISLLSNEVTRLKPMKIGRSNFCAQLDPQNSYIFVFGGMDEHGNALDSIEYYDLILDGWIIMGDVKLKSPKHDLHCFWNGDDLVYIMGGKDQNLGGKVYDDIEIFNLKTMKFEDNSKKMVFPTPVADRVCVSRDIETAYLIGGSIAGLNEKPNTTIFTYRYIDQTWDKLKISTSKIGSAILLVNDKNYKLTW
eukprot:gene2104-2592_t